MSWLTLISLIVLNLSLNYCHRFSKLPGGIFEIDPVELPEDVIHFTEHEINKMGFSPYYLRVGKILVAGSQVVAGTNFYLSFELIRTTCLKDHRTNCLDSKIRRICSAKVFRPLPVYGDELEFYDDAFDCLDSKRSELGNYFRAV